MGRLLTGLLTATALMPISANAGTILSWSYDNVEVGPVVAGEDAGASVVYDRVIPDASAETNGLIYYAAPEAQSPGLEVSNTGYTTGQGTYDGCILASSTAECDSDFQSGKRFKEHVTDNGSIDLVFDVEANNLDALYQVFHRVVNKTGQQIESFNLELGFGIGESFVASVAGDGLGFSQTVELGPNNLPAFSQFPFGLFGDDAQPNPNPVFTLDGFFDGDSRAGYNLALTEDTISSDGLYGGYEALFGNWVSQEDVPDGLLWDYALGAADPLVMAWDNGLGWEVRRGIDDALDGVLGVISVNDVYALAEQDWAFYDYLDIAGVETFLSSVSLFEDAIEDLANLNLNYALALGSNFVGDSFTLRFDSTPVVIPLPAAGLLMIAGLGMLGAQRRRQRRRQRT